MKLKVEDKNKKPAVIFWILAAVCLGLIFFFSSRNANESSAQSDFFLQLINKIFGDGKVSAFIVRKAAHFTEFMGTCLIMSAAFYFTLGKNRLYLPICFTSLYAVTDEIHQIFVKGRSCELRDWAIDTLGAILGAAIYFAIYHIIKRFLKTRNKEEE